MAQDEIVVKYKVDASEFGKVGVAVNAVTQETQELGNQIKSTFADKSIEAATKKLFEQGDVMGALVNKYGNATSALKAMEKELITMAALGQRGTKSFEELAKATAELKDTVGDTRGEIKKMASDTRVFDTMVQGARGVAAAFSVATGVAAAFGSENENVQKTLVKVQGAIAALQGVQELANIATEKGGIATKAYGVALTVVDKISKITGLSMAASWALATGGITLVIGAVASLIYLLGSQDDKSEEVAEKKKKRDEEEIKRLKNIDEAQKITKDIANSSLDEFDRQQDKRRKKAIIKGEDLNKVELGLLHEKLKQSEMDLKDYHLHGDFMDAKSAKDYKQRLEDRYLDTQVALKKLQDLMNKGLKPKSPGISAFVTKEDNGIEPLITEEMVAENKENGDQMAKDFAKIYTDGVKTEADSVAKRKALQDSYFAAVGKGISALSNLTSAIFAQETQTLTEEKDAQLNQLDKQHEREILAAGDNAERKKYVEERYAKRKADLEKKHAIESAKIQRQQAIANKAFAILNIALNTAQAIIKFLEDPGGYQGIALSAIAGVTGGIEAAAVAAQPLPSIPKFEKGGAVVLAGGTMRDGHLFGRSHREGGMLINAQGGEFVWDRETTAKHNDIIRAAHENRIEDLVLHKYVVPMMRAKENAQASIESYDDMLLRSTIKQSNKQTAKYIVDGISHNMKDTLYFANRYK